MANMQCLFLLSIVLLHLTAAKQLNADVTLRINDIPLLFTEDEIFGMEFKDQSKGIMKINVVVNETKSIQISKHNQIIEYNIIWDDIEDAFRKERERIDNVPEWNATMRPDLFFLEYRTWPQYEVFLAALLFRHNSSIASGGFLSQATIQGREIPVITLSTGDPSDGTKPGFYIQAELHAREWLANSATTWILNALCEAYDDAEHEFHERVTTILNAINIYIVPTVNIDGYIYAWEANRNWRKNRRANTGGTFGVDLNRNYDGPTGTWCTTGASTNPNSDTYCGTSPFSEPEVDATRDFILDPNHNIQAMFDMHTSGPMVLWPWGYTYDQLPPAEYQRFQTLGASMEEAIRSVNGVTYVSMQSSDLYPASGAAEDFSYSQTSANAVSFTFEGRGPGFNPSPSNIIPGGQEQLAAVLLVAETLF